MVRRGTLAASPFTRRSFLATASATLAVARTGRADDAGPRLAAIDWAMFETAVALGHMPIAACELIQFRARSPAISVPQNVVDLGLRGAPNFELMQLVRPELILSSPYYTHYESRLTRLCPVLNLPFYIRSEPPLPKTISALHDLGAAIGDPAAAVQAEADAEAELDAIARELTDYSDRPLCLINIGDARHLRAYGFDSLFGSVVSRLGLINAWEGRTRFKFRAPVPIEQLATMPEARLVIVGDVPVFARRSLSRAKLWEALPSVSEGRLYQLAEVNAFGGIPSALRFARLLRDALTRQQEVTL